MAEHRSQRRKYLAALAAGSLALEIASPTQPLAEPSKCETADRCQACKSQCESESNRDLRDCDSRHRLGLPRNIECRDQVYDRRAKCVSAC